MADLQRSLMRAAGALSIRLYRVSGGRVMGKVRGATVLLLTVPGRTTGVPHTTPVSYFEDAGSYVVSGTAGGAPRDPQWFRNLRQAERAVVEIGRERVDVTVSVAGPEEREELWRKLVARYPFFGGYKTKVERTIPMARLTPVRGATPAS